MAQDGADRAIDGWRHELATVRATPVLWPLALLVIVSAFISFVSLRALGSIVPVSFLIAAGLYVVQERRLPRPSTGLLVAWAVFVALVGLAAFRSLDVDYATGRFGKVVGLSLIAILFWTMAGSLAGLKTLRPILIGAFLFGLAWALVEGLGDGVIFWLTHDITRGEAVHASNRPIVLLVLFLWPAALAISQTRGQMVAWAVVFFTMGCTFATESQSAQLATFVASLVLGLALVLPRFTHLLVMGAGAFAILALPFILLQTDIMLLEGSAFASKSTILPRLELWSYVADKIAARPLLGYGLEAGRFLPMDDVPHKYFSGLYMHHPHNGIMQIWFEMGLLGAAAAALGWVLLVRRAGFLPPSERAYVLAGLTAFLVISSVSHGLWQSWWVSGLAVLPFFFAIVLRRGVAAP